MRKDGRSLSKGKGSVQWEQMGGEGAGDIIKGQVLGLWSLGQGQHQGWWSLGWGSSDLTPFWILCVRSRLSPLGAYWLLM